MTFDEWWNNWSVKDWNDIESAKNLFQQAFEVGVHADVHTDNSKVIAELEEKLANADYQLEGRDLKIKQLEEEKDKAWWEGFDTCKAKAGEANVKLSDEINLLKEQIEKLIDFVLSKTECCDVCPITDTCNNSEGTCHYAGILAKGEEEVTREWLMQKITKEIKEK